MEIVGIRENHNSQLELGEPSKIVEIGDNLKLTMQHVQAQATLPILVHFGKELWGHRRDDIIIQSSKWQS